MTIVKLLQDRAGQSLALVGLLFLASALLLLTLLNTPAPAIDLVFGDTTIKMAADRAWTYFPGGCVNISWELEGIKSLYIEGEGKIGQGEIPYCPSINVTSPLIEVTASNGIYRRIDLDIHHLPDLIFYLVGFVGLVGSCLLAAFYLRFHRPDRPLPMYWLLMGTLILSVIGATIRLRPTHLPILDEDTGEVAVRFWAENDRLLFPHECVKVWWSVVGHNELKFNGTAVPAADFVGNGNHCAEDGDRATLEVLSNEGNRRLYELPIPSLFSSTHTPAPIFLWSVLAILLCLIVYVPWIVQAIRSSWGRGLKKDLLAAAGCLFFVLMLYLPFGFSSAGHWEEWIIRGYFESGTPSFYRTEAVSRFFVMIPHAIAHLLSPDSFVGYHLVNLLMYSGSMILLYGILRHFGMSPLYAFLTSILYMAYPVNSALMTLRRLPNNFSVIALFAAIFLILDYSKRPKRSTLLGLWLSLMFSVYTNETGFAIILAVPLLWWLRQRRLNWRNLNLTAIWYLAPAFKLAYISSCFCSPIGTSIRAGSLKAIQQTRHIPTPFSIRPYK